MKKTFAIVIVCISIGAFQGCYYDKDELVYPVTNCDTTNVTYATHISGIIQAKCSGCHTGAVTSGFNFSILGPLQARALNGVLMDRLTTSDLSRRMPQGGSMLPACEIDKFRAWIKRGAK
jgi:hypothetical protein